MAFKYIVLRPIFEIIISILWVYKLILIVRIVLSWVNPDPYNPIVRFMHSITDPLLYKIKQVIPLQIGALDLSPLILFVLIEIISRGLQWLIK